MATGLIDHEIVAQFEAQMIPYVVTGLGTAFVGIIGALSTFAVRYLQKLGRKWDSEKLNQALTNAAGGVIQRVGPVDAMKIKPDDPIVVKFAARVNKGLADEIANLKIDPETVPQRVIDKIPIILPVDGQARGE